MGNPNTEAVKKSRKKHQVVEIKLRYPLEEKNQIAAFAESKGKPLATYIRDLIAEDMAKNP